MNFFALDRSDCVSSLPLRTKFKLHMASKVLGDLIGLLSDFISCHSCLKCCASATLDFSYFLNTLSSGLLFKNTSCGLHLNALSQYFLTTSPFSSTFREPPKLRQLLPHHLLSSHHSHFFFFIGNYVVH